jgi:hypothetical protein
MYFKFKVMGGLIMNNIYQKLASKETTRLGTKLSKLLPLKTVVHSLQLHNH